MTETDNVATYARIRPYNPAINEDKRLTARAQDGNKILNSNGDKTDTYNFTRVYDMKHGTMDLFETGMKPLLEYKILQGINSIFIVYGQSGSGKSFTLIGEKGHLGVLPLSLQYLLEQDCVERIDVSSIEAYGIKATKIGFYDLVTQLETKKKAPKKYDPYTTKDNSRLNAGNASILEITRDNCLQIITELQEVSHMAPTLKNPHSSRGHTVYFCRVKMKGLEDVYFICVDLAGSEGATALGTKDEFVTGLKLAMSKGKLKLSKKQMKGFEQMYKTRFYEAACINNGLTQLQSIFGELIKQKISKSQGLGLRKVLSSFINLKTAYAILFTLSASANNNKTTRATLNFAKQTQLVKVDTQKAKKKIDKDAIIKELNTLIEKLQGEMDQKDKTILDLKKAIKSGGGDPNNIAGADENIDIDDTDNNNDNDNKDEETDNVLDRIKELNEQLQEAEEQEKQWTVSEEDIKSGVLKEDDMKEIFDEFDVDGGGSIDADELQDALTKMGINKTMSEVNELIEEIDEDENGEVDFDEFKQMASKNWFVDAFQSKLVEQMQKALESTMNMNDNDEKDDIELLDKDADELIDELKERKQTIMDLKDEIEIMKNNGDLNVFDDDDNDELIEDIKIKDENIQRLEEQLENLHIEFNDIKNQKNENESKYQIEIDSVKNEINSIKNEKNENENKNQIEIDNLKNEINGIKNEKNENENKNQTEIDRLKNEMETLKEKQSVSMENSEKNEEMEKMLSDMNNKINDIKIENNKLQNDNNVLNEENKEIKNNKNILGEENNILKGNIEMVKKEYDELKERMDGLQRENNTLKSDINNINNENKELKNNMENNNEIGAGRIKELENKNNELKQQIIEFENEFERMKNNIGVLKNENNELKDETNGLENNLKELTESKINMIKECNQQINLLRKGVIAYQRKAKNGYKLPFSVDFRWED